MQHLKESDIARRLGFARWMKEHIEILDVLWFSDEADFYSNAQVKRRIEKPNIYIVKPLHDEKVTVRAAMSATGRVGPFFFEDDFRDVQTINTERYLNVLKNKFLPALRRRGVDMNNIWFHQDGATPHTSLRSIAWMEENFRDISSSSRQKMSGHLIFLI